MNLYRRHCGGECRTADRVCSAISIVCFLVSFACAGAEAAGSSSTAAGKSATEGLAARLAKIARAGPVHPRLHLRPGDRERLLEESKTFRKAYWEELNQWLEENKHWQPASGAGDDELNEVDLEQSAAFLTNAALVAFVTGKDEDVELAKRWALAMCTVPKERARNYAYGIYAAGLARAYDWLYDRLSPPERAVLRNHIARIVRYQCEGSFPGRSGSLWWASCYLHHDFWVPTGGYGEAALALVGEVEEAPQWAARARAEFDEALSWLGDDGAWHEGPADWCYAMAPLLWFFGAWQSVTGESPHDTPWIRNTATYRLYHRLNDESYVNLDDSFRCGRYNTSGSASSHLLRRLASLFRDGHAQWLAARDEVFDRRRPPKGVPQAPYEGSSRARTWREYPHTQSQYVAWNFLWFDPTVETRPPNDLPPSHHFANQGIAILRSDWGESATVVSLTCGPMGGHRAVERMRSGESLGAANFYHVHVDFNDLTLSSRGEYFIIPPGYARRDSAFHNTIAVNGAHLRPDAQAQPRIIAFGATPPYDYAVGDACEGFAPYVGVSRALRYIVLLRPDWAITYDDVRLAQQEWSDRPWRRFDWSMHSDPTRHRVELSRNQAVWRAQKGNAGQGLAMRVLAPEEFAWQDDVLRSADGEPLLHSLQLTVSKWYRPDMQVLAAWHAEPFSEEMEAVAVPARSLHAVRIAAAKQSWVVAFWNGRADAGGSAVKAAYSCAGPHRLLVFGLPMTQNYQVTRGAQGQVEIAGKGALQPKDGGMLDVSVE